MSVRLSAAGVRAVLLDIEGTTTPIDFVYGVLFPFARQRVRSHLEATLSSDPEVGVAIAGLREEHDADVAAGQAPPAWREDTPEARLDSAAAYVHWLMDRDRKSKALKLLQGKIWEQGYLSGALRGDVYPDVPDALRRWTAAGIDVGIFSSGSVLAQTLLFGRSAAGDLTPFLRWHFDTGVGSKLDAASYRRIVDAMAVPASGILFVSDAVPELDAAHAAGLQTRLCIRPPAQWPPAADRHAVIRTFDEIE